MRNLVLDSSVIVKWLNKDRELHVDQADRILYDSMDGKVELFAPELARYEIGNVLLRGKQLTANSAVTAIETAYALPITFISESVEMARDTFSVAAKLNITYYDASFICLAKYYNAFLVTENVKHQGKKIKGKPAVKIISLQDYSSTIGSAWIDISKGR